ncbi:uncharacterized protein LOC117112673 [Anneissia japonica]|uniref:uncharacterized protein LOC117112673 n=1 Tax=Anneissia japonica TaxID=1529436 RepID=UPI0014254B9C|nr:uncharacterized protein LOC117112673 [Anneissia japonica]XP_033111694.1 uncharacterized protein LOC117112673 [Anneissia japonica]
MEKRLQVKSIVGIILILPALSKADTCGVSQNCFREPTDCFPATSCTYFVGWSLSNSGNALDMEFSMSGANGYIAVGFSKDQLMPNSDIVGCLSNGTVNRYYATERMPPIQQDAGGLTNQTITMGDDGVLTCSFTRELSNESLQNFFNLNEDHYIILAKGGLDRESIGYHMNNRYISDSAYDLKSPVDTCGFSQSCFRSPGNCFPASTCTYFVRWSRSPSGDALDFEFTFSGSSGYIAIGFSKDNKMPNSDIVGCLSNGTVDRYYATERMLPTPQGAGGLSNENVTMGDDGVITCSFTRELSNESLQNFFNLNEDHYLILAKGDSGDALSYHMGNRYFSDSGYNLTSAPISIDVTVTTQQPGEPTGDTCAISQSCFRSPANCFPASVCTYFVGWSVSPSRDALDFEFSIKSSSGYIAIGFSKDNKMPNSDIVGCLSNGAVDRYYATGNIPPTQQDAGGLSNKNVNVDDGVLTCSFTRQLSDESLQNFFNLNEDHYLILAKGDSGDALSYHTNRYASNTGFDLTSAPVSIGGSGSDDSYLKKIKAHGSLMIIGWIGLASIGVLTARYFKKVWPNTTVFGKNIWFRIHSTCMITAWLSFASSFILIFVTVDGWVGKGKGNTTFYHAIIGSTAVGLGTLNPIMAIFRPHPGTPRRPIFNVLHFSVGFLGWLSAIVTVFFGVRIYYMEIDKVTDIDAFNVLIGFAVFILLMFIILEVHGFCNKKQDTPGDVALDTFDSATDAPFKQGQNSSTQENPGSTVKTILYILYIAGVLLTVGYLVVTIVMKD